MKLVRKPGRVLRHSSSLRLIEAFTAITILQVVADAAPAFKDFLPIDVVWLTVAASVAGVAAWAARFVLQAKMRPSDDEQA